MSPSCRAPSALPASLSLRGQSEVTLDELIKDLPILPKTQDLDPA
jgi:hypothetical protein